VEYAPKRKRIHVRILIYMRNKVSLK
jgi:hypothetical protein